MTAPRFVQNFRQRRALVVSLDGRALEMLDRTLVKLGVSVAYAILEGDQAALREEDLDPGRDIIFADGDLDRPLDLPVSPISGNPVVPTIGLVGVEAPSRLKGLIQIGASAFLRKPVHGATVYSALVNGINAFLRKQQMESCIQGHEMRRRQRRVVVKAILEMMRADGVDDDQAYVQLRRESMRVRMSIEEFCEHFVRMRATVNPRDPKPEKRRMTAD